MISTEIQLSRLVFTLSSITLALGAPHAFEQMSGLLIILLLSITVIPHGALDHIVFYQLYHNRYKSIDAFRRIMDKLVFYAHYLCIMVVWGVSWQYQMSITFMIFLGLSAYHFGEVFAITQKKGDLDYIRLKSGYQRILFLSRGVFLLSLAILTRPKLTITIVERFVKVSGTWSFETMNQVLVLQHFFLLSVYLVLSLYTGDMKDASIAQFPITRSDPGYKVWTYEILKSGLFWILFNSMNPLVGFLVYLGPWHSLGHMLSEISLLKYHLNPAFAQNKKVEWSDVGRFLYLTAPFTTISLSSMTGAYFLAFGSQSLTLENVNAWAVFVISISILTGPHLWVVAAMHYKSVDLDPLNIRNTVSLLYKTLKSS